MATGQEIDWTLDLQPLLTTRDGTSVKSKDGSMWNCFAEPFEGQQGEMSTVKRPGLFRIQQLPAGTAQGTFLVNNTMYAIQNDIIYNITTGVPTAIPSVTNPGEIYYVLSDTPFGTTLLKSITGLWIFNGTTVTKVTDPNYPILTTAGIAYLDGTYYVQDGNGIIWNSNFQDPTTWPPLGFIAADGSLGHGQGIHRHLNYILSFYEYGMQTFYDGNNNPPASPLLPVGNAQFQTGTPSGDSIVEMQDTTFFMSRSTQFGRSVSIMSGLSLQQISTPFVDKLLNLSDLGNIQASGVRTAGHSFYLLRLQNLGLTLAYNMTTQRWDLWTSVVNSTEITFRGIFYVGTPTSDVFMDSEGTGAVFQLLENSYQDFSQPINVRIRTSRKDWGNLKTKRIAASYLLADTQNTTVQLRWSDDDYQTWSAYRNVLMTVIKKQARLCGKTRTRAFELLHTENTPLRVNKLDFDMSVGPA